jgi:NAD(P)-dependent dehydrogenase (short-subunit alcohol dehydrogenase family)
MKGDLQMRPVVITGASTGIGYGAAAVFTRQGCPVFGTVRNSADGERLQAELGPLFSPLICDVTDHAAVRAAAASVEAQVGGAGIGGLINNAGMLSSGPLMHQPLAEVERHFAVNVIGLLAVTQAFLPLLGARPQATNPPGRILNISSVGGRIASPFIGAYAASKHAVEGLSDSLRRELQLYGIDVIVIQPGAVRTAIWNKPGASSAATYAHTGYATPLERFEAYARELERGGYAPEAFGSLLWNAYTSPQPRARYTFTPGRLLNWTIPRLLPARWVDRIIGQNFGLTGGAQPGVSAQRRAAK